jgi:lipopolysaccharide transport system ATP-binding protein
MTAVIRAEGLGKRYRRGVVEPRGMLRDSLARFVRSPLAALRPPAQEQFWALRDVELEVKEGEVLGLIGRNGAGKTTLLKILSRITRPSTGWAEIHGRVRSLLEVGTGFHGELTGRENTYLSGSILGMSKREISRKFDEIVAFAEIEKFIDTPVKHYSSGMYVRLAFAVAAHLEPEILLVDEVLAVGDINFQKKCLGKMGDVARAGRTIILVSHQLVPIRQLCGRVVWLHDGKIHQLGPTPDVVNLYEANARSAEVVDLKRPDGNRAQFLSWKVEGSDLGQSNVLEHEGEVRFTFVVKVNEPLRSVHHGIALYDQERKVLWGNGVDGLILEPGIHELKWMMSWLPLQPGVYQWRVSIYDHWDRVDDWDCMPPMFISTTPRTHRRDEFAGILNVPSHFATIPADQKCSDMNG